MIGVKIPGNAFVGMDYHLDWIAASLRAHQNPDYLGKPVSNAGQTKFNRVATGTQQDIDLLVAFKEEGFFHLVLLEAKGYDSWTNRQMGRKSQRLQGIFGKNGKGYPEVKSYFCLMSPRRPEKLQTKGWPTWMTGSGDDPYLWLKLNVDYPRFQVMRCDSDGKPKAEGSHFRIKTVQSPISGYKPIRE